MDFPFKWYQSGSRKRNHDTTKSKYDKELPKWITINRKQIQIVYTLFPRIFGSCFGTILYYLFRGFDILFHEMALQHGVSSENEVDLQTELTIKEI